MSSQENSRESTPFPVTIVLWLGLILTIARIWESWALYQFLTYDSPFEIDLRWRLGAAVMWAIIFAWFTIALWSKRLYAYRLLPILFLLHTLYQIGWRYYAPSRPSNWFSPVFLGLILVGMSIYILITHAPQRST